MPPVPSLTDIALEAEKAATALQGAKRQRIVPVSEEVGSLDEVHRDEASHIVRSSIPIEKPGELHRLTYLAAPEPPAPPHLGVDGSSRLLEAYDLLVGVYSAAVSVVDGAYLVGSYPDTGAYPAIDAGGAPVASLAPGVGAGLRYVAERPLVDPAAVVKVADCSTRYRDQTCRQVARVGYGSGYNTPTMLDENRSFLENRALHYIASHGLASGGARVLVDGPLYMTPGLLVQFYRAARGLRFPSARLLLQTVYVLSYMVNTLHRVRIVEALQQAGATVVGVVKRISRSRLLVNALHGLEGVDRDALPHTDPQLVEQLLRRVLAAHLPPYAYGAAAIVGPVVSIIDLSLVAEAVKEALGGGAATLTAYNSPVTRTGETLAQLLSEMRRRHYVAKRSYYLVVKGHMSRYQMYRVEFPQLLGQPPLRVDSSGGASVAADPSTLRTIVEADAQVLAEIAWLATQPRLLDTPLPIALADRVSKTVSRSAAIVWFNALSSHTIFTYDTLVQIAG